MAECEPIHGVAWGVRKGCEERLCTHPGQGIASETSRKFVTMCHVVMDGEKPPSARCNYLARSVSTEKANGHASAGRGTPSPPGRPEAFGGLSSLAPLTRGRSPSRRWPGSPGRRFRNAQNAPHPSIGKHIAGSICLWTVANSQGRERAEPTQPAAAGRLCPSADGHRTARPSCRPTRPQTGRIRARGRA